MASPCARTNLAGVVYEEFSCLYPFLQSFYSRCVQRALFCRFLVENHTTTTTTHSHLFLFGSYEIAYDPVPIRDWMVSAPWLPILAVVIYGLVIVVGSSYFKKRDPWNWRKVLAFWNLGLATFSALGFLRVMPQVVHNLIYFSFAQNMCADPEAHYGSGSTGLWVQLFVLSKFPYVTIHWRLCYVVLIHSTHLALTKQDTLWQGTY